MSEDTITFRLDRTKRAALDRLAEGMARSRGDLLNEAVDAYLETQARRVKHIAEGLRQADAGEFASDEEVANAFRRLRE